MVGQVGQVGLVGLVGLVGRVRQVGRVGQDRNASGSDIAQLATVSQRHEQLVAWQRADDLFVRIHQLAARFPAQERFELGSQLRRASYSVPANIVEGFARRSIRERVRFLNIAEASLAEVGYCLHVARRLGYLEEREYAEVLKSVNGAAAPLVGLLRAVRAERDQPA